VYADRVQLFKGSAVIQGWYTYLRVGLARTIYIRVCTVFLAQGNHQMYGHIRCIYTVLANPIQGQCSYSRVVHLFKG